MTTATRNPKARVVAQFECVSCLGTGAEAPGESCGSCDGQGYYEQVVMLNENALFTLARALGPMLARLARAQVSAPSGDETAGMLAPGMAPWPFRRPRGDAS